MSDMGLAGDLGLEDMIDDLEQDIEQTVLDMAETMYVYQTNPIFGAVPIDTGRYRNSWNASINEPDEEHPDINDDGPFPQPEFDLTMDDFELGDTIVLNNSLPYAVPLNEGHVSQVKSRFFEANFEAAFGAVGRTGIGREGISDIGDFRNTGL